jgi:iron complex outermembrane receptor protein
MSGFSSPTECFGMRRRFGGAALILACMLGGALPANAQERAAATGSHQNKPATALQSVVVTGTRALDRTEADSLAPIDVLTREDLASTGAPDLDSALRILLPAFNFPQPSINGDTDATQPAQLRGLSPDQVLVLINGKRQHTTAQVMVTAPLAIGRGSSPVDLSAIPINAIARIEVLRDGAAAQYGSDAIAGVINIILKRGAEHGSFNAGYGQHDGAQGKTWRSGADGGFKLGDAGWVHLAANYLNQDATNHAAPDRRYPGDPTYDTVTVRYGLPREIARQAAVNMAYRFGPHATLYGFSVFNKRDVRVGESFRAVSTYADTNPAAAARYPRGFLPIQVSAIRDDNSVLGVRGELAGWHYDVSADSGGNHVKAHTAHTLNFALGAASPTSFYTGTLALRQNELNADFKREFDMPWEAPLTLAWGLAYRHEKYNIKPGAAASYTGSGG